MQEAVARRKIPQETKDTVEANGKPGDQRRVQVRKWAILPVEALGQEQLSSISAVHERCARAIAEQLGTGLRVEFEGTLVSVQQSTLADYLEQFFEPAYLALLNLSPLDESAVLQIDTNLAFALLDVLLGGSGQADNTVREFTEIEEQLLETMGSLVAQSVQRTWNDSGANLEFSFQKRQRREELSCLAPQWESALISKFELRMNELCGNLTLAFPASALNRLFRLKVTDNPTVRRPGSAAESAKLKQRLLGCGIRAELVLLDAKLPADSLLGLKLGSVLNLGKSSEEPISVVVGGTETFSAYPVSSGNNRAALLHGRINPKNVTSEVNHG